MIFIGLDTHKEFHEVAYCDYTGRNFHWQLVTHKVTISA